MRVGLLEMVWVVEGWLVRSVGRGALMVASMLCVMFVGGLVWWVGNLVAVQRDRAVAVRRWNDMGRPLESVLTRFPDRVTNASALRLEKLAAPLGVDLVPHVEKDRSQLDEAVAAEHAAINPVIKEFAALVARTTTRDTGPVPMELQEFLRSHEPELGAVAQHLLAAEPPRWRQQVGEGYDAPFPNLLGHIQLARLLSVRAVYLIRQGKLEAGADSTEAAWRLHLTAAERPELLSQLISLAEAKMVAGAVRCHPKPPFHWPSMLLEHDYRASLLDSFHNEAWLALNMARSGGILDGGGAAGWILQKLVFPYVMHEMARTIEAYRLAIEKLPSIPFTDYDPGEGFSVALETVVGDAWVARVGLADIWGPWAQVGRGMLCLEMSALAVELDNSGTTRWEKSFTDRPSRLMPSVTWRLTREAGGLRIAPLEELPPVSPTAQKSMCESFLLEDPQ